MGIVYVAMAYPNPITLKFSILLIVMLAFEPRETISFHRVTIAIINDTAPQPTSTNIIVHCKSKDDDLGFHTLVFEGSWKFKFTPIFFPDLRSTLFFCSFTWPGNPHRHYLDIYDQNHDSCWYCRWKINIDGGCLNSHKCGHWKSVKLMDAYNTSKWPRRTGFVE